MAAVENEAFDFAAMDDIAAALCIGEVLSLDRLFTRAGVTAPVVEWEPGPDNLANDGLRCLLDHWRTLTGSAPLPLAATLDPLDLKPVIGNMMLVDVVDGGRNFRYRLYGSSIARFSRGDKTGRLVTDFDGLPARFFYVVYRAVLQRPVPVYTHHVPSNAKNFREWHRLILPLGDETGAVTRFLVGSYPGPEYASQPGVGH